MVKGPCYLTVKVGRNYSFNTILASAMLDKVDPTPAPYARSYAEQSVADNNDMGVRVYAAGEADAEYLKRFENNSEEKWTAWNLYHALDYARLRNPIWWARNGRRYQLPLARWFEVAWKRANSEKLPLYLDRLAMLYYRTNQFEKWEAILDRQKITTPREVEKSLFYDGKATNLSGGEAELVAKWRAGTMEVASKEASLKNIDVK